MNRQLQEQISAYFDGELPPEQHAEVERALADDSQAGRYFAELNALHGVLSDLPRLKLSGDFHLQVLRQAEREMLTGESSKPPASQNGRPITSAATQEAAPEARSQPVSHSTGYQRWNGPAILALATAASLLLALWLNRAPGPGATDSENHQVAMQPAPEKNKASAPLAQEEAASDAAEFPSGNFADDPLPTNGRPAAEDAAALKAPADPIKENSAADKQAGDRTPPAPAASPAAGLSAERVMRSRRDLPGRAGNADQADGLATGASKRGKAAIGPPSSAVYVCDVRGGVDEAVAGFVQALQRQGIQLQVQPSEGAKVNNALREKQEQVAQGEDRVFVVQAPAELIEAALDETARQEGTSLTVAASDHLDVAESRSEAKSSNSLARKLQDQSGGDDGQSSTTLKADKKRPPAGAATPPVEADVVKKPAEAPRKTGDEKETADGLAKSPEEFGKARAFKFTQPTAERPEADQSDGAPMDRRQNRSANLQQQGEPPAARVLIIFRAADK